MADRSMGGGPAFPHDRHHDQPGMSLRDWFAGQALVGAARETIDDITIHGRQAIVTEAYAIADAMLAERAKAVSHG